MASESPIFPVNSKEPGALSDTLRKLEQLRKASPFADDATSKSEVKEEAEQALESHEVVELQAFIERTEWIEEKIQFLESLPAIEVLAGMEELSKPHDQISGLATRAQLNDWLIEHDRIEKETEIFDSGDLRKLKKLTKAATQRNLSPEDTDLIELTLTTLLALDKLLHLLRNRSEQLDLLGLRLTWEEHRAKAYSSQAEIVAELRDFLDSRARWSPQIYSSEGMSSSASVVPSPSGSTSVETHDSFSRSARFKLAEELSKDAAQFSSRITSLRHGPVSAAGKSLDKLIDDSRDPLPDPMLDEQDRIEEKCDKNLASVGKFVMAVVMQWKKADEIYVETRKDYSAARILLDDINRIAKQHPLRRNETVLSTRIDVLTKRLSTRTNPSSSVTTFPLPIHSLFPEQVLFNATLVQILSAELLGAHDMVKEADNSLKSFRTGCQVVETAEALREELSEYQRKLASATHRFQYGFEADDGDGSPPDLTHLSCVEPLRSAVYLAMLPSLVEETLQSEQPTIQLIKRARIAALHLDRPGIDDAFKRSFLEEIDGLEAHLNAVMKVRNDVSADVSRLRDVRRIWSAMDGITKSLDTVCAEISDALIRHRWKQQIGGEMAPPTPESPRPVLPADLATPDSVKTSLHALREQLMQDVISPLGFLSSSLPMTLYNFVDSRRHSIESLISDAQSMKDLWQDVRKQTSAMESVREEAHALENRIEDAKVQYDEHFQTMLSSTDSACESIISTADEDITAKEASLAKGVDSVQADVSVLVESLPSRVPFISRRSSKARMKADDTVSTSLLSENISSSKAYIPLTARLPFDPAIIDKVVRSDSNAYAIRLSGGVKSLLHKRSFTGFYGIARSMSRQLMKTREDIHTVNNQLEEKARAFEELSDAVPDGMVDHQFLLSSIRESLETVMEIDGSRIGRLISIAREDIAQMRAIPGVQDDVTNLNVLSMRTSALDEVDLQSHRLFAKVDALKAEISKAENTEVARLAEKARKEREENEEAEKRKVLEDSTRRQEEQNDAMRAMKERLEQEMARQRTDDAATSKARESKVLFEDVFGPHTPSDQGIVDKETTELLIRIRSLRKRLKSIGLNNVARPSVASLRHSSNASLPTMHTADAMSNDFACVDVEVAALPALVQNSVVDTELRSLRLEAEASRGLVRRVQQLAQLSSSIFLCDTAFSEFLDHIDNYHPAPLLKEDDTLAPSDLRVSSEEQLSERMSHTKGIVGDMSEHYSPVADDPRAVAEHNRLKQTWDELMEMALEKISGRVSRPESVIASSSGRNSSASMSSVKPPDVKRNKYTRLSLSNRSGFLAPSTQRRAVSSSSTESSKQPLEAPSRSNISFSRSHNQRSVSQRSVSGPLNPPSTTSSSLYSSTFASRQRTASMSSTMSSVVSGSIPPVPTVPVGFMRRRMSSALSEASRVGTPTMSTNTRGSWSRAPRQSFSSFSRAVTPEKVAQRKPKKYVANPKNKLDVAVGDVVNNLPVSIDVEAAEAPKDRSTSGKYFIGYGDEAKLCFCRILRSQTVMVRVGGGWAELSKFIKGHFADLFTLMPETPPRPGSKERWISASTLRNAAGDDSASTKSPGSPESLGPSLPSFAISTPDGSKTQSLQSSPLTPLKFMRRADVDPSEFSLSSMALSAGSSAGLPTPSFSSSMRPGRSAPNTPSKQAAWKP
ncbi:hypothetical protein DFH11DRAFT_1566963 [Phellopilus nigrolimitatus]|nr:hypothetical protein DFH11DRAFT_1566963 [Phellopilus nigrolimitatus]